MSIGAILIGLTAATLVVSYVARPLQRGRGHDIDRIIDRWVAQAQTGEKPETEEPGNFCPRCGRRVEPDHRFCPGCGTELQA